ncbi:MAG: hypothetical protein U5S82_23365 [Gammaproteobacteria bacterium]|nr:hypothetical protein [Gammaproteobacteria bacterium]
MRDFDAVMADIRRSPEHGRRAAAVRQARWQAVAGLAAGGLLVGGGGMAFAAGAGGLVPVLAAGLAGAGLLWFSWTRFAAYGRHAAAADRALFLDSLRHARTLGDLRACGFIDPNEFMFDLMPVEEKLDMAPEPGIPLGPDCACDDTDLDGELGGIEAAARRLGYGKGGE